MSTVICPGCKNEVPRLPFCNQCGNKLNGEEKTDISGNIWQSPRDQFAARIDINDLEGFFKKKLIVEEGTRALLFESGKNIGELEAGTYTLDSFLRKFTHFGRSRKLSVVITKKSNLPLIFNIANCQTKEFLSVDVKVEVDFRVEDTALFVRNLLGGAKVYTEANLREVCYSTINNGIKREFSKYSIEELSNNYDLIDVFQKGIELSLSATLEGFGLKFMHIKAFDFKHEAYDEMNKKKGECFLLIKKEEAELEHKQMLQDVYSKNDLLEINEIKRQNQKENMINSLELEQESLELDQQFERFNNIEKKKLELVNAKFINTELAKVELEKFASEMEREKLAREHDLKKTKRELVEEDFDAERARRQMLELLDISQKEEVDKARFEASKRMEIRNYEHDQEIAMRVESEDNRKRQELLKREKEDSERELEKIRAVRNNMADANEFKRMQSSLDHKIEREIRLEHESDAFAKKKREHEIELQIQEEKRKAAMAAKKQEYDLNKEVQKSNLDITKQLNEMNRQEAEFVYEQERTDKQHDSDIKIKEQESVAKIERDKIEAMKDLRPETLIALAPVEQAEILAKLEKTKELKGMSAEQILAMSAENNPAVADAFKALQTNAMSERERELFKKMLEQKDEVAKREAQAHQDANKSIQDLSKNAMANLTDMAKSMAQSMGGNQGTPIVVTGNGVTNTSVPQQTEQKTKTIFRCPHCKAENDSTAKCCSNCGQQL